MVNETRTRHVKPREQVASSVEKAYDAIVKRYESDKSFGRTKSDDIIQEWADREHVQLFDADGLTKLMADAGRISVFCPHP